MSDNGALPIKLTGRQRDLLSILSDGEPHLFPELMRLMDYSDDEQHSIFNLVSSLRKLLRPIGQYIVWETNARGLAGYRWVRLISPADLARLQVG